MRASERILLLLVTCEELSGLGLMLGLTSCWWNERRLGRLVGARRCWSFERERRAWHWWLKRRNSRQR